MRKTPVVLLLAGVASSVLLVGCGSAAARRVRLRSQVATERVVLISWDGSQEAHVRESMAQGLLPNLKELADEGGFAEVYISDHVTETMTGHVEMLTGYPPEITGVFNPHRGSRQPVLAELFVMTRLEGFFGEESVETVFLASKSWRLGSLPGQPYALVRSVLDIWDGDRDRPAAVTGPLAVQYVSLGAQSGRKLFCFIHFHDPDVAGHSHGENSPEYEAALETCDYWLGRIRAVLAETSLQAPGAIMVTTDHGFIENGYGHADARRAWLATNWGRLARGDQKDIVPTILSMYGIDYHQFLPPLPGRPLLSGASRPAAGVR